MTERSDSTLPFDVRLNTRVDATIWHLPNELKDLVAFFFETLGMLGPNVMCMVPDTKGKDGGWAMYKCGLNPGVLICFTLVRNVIYVTEVSWPVNIVELREVDIKDEVRGSEQT